MDKLEVGMYVRTDLGIIARLTEVFDFKYKTYYLNFSNAAVNCKQNDVIHNKGKILKASHNPIDLIEPNDLLEIEFFSPRYQEHFIRLFEVVYVENKTIRLTNANCELNIFNGTWSNKDKKFEPKILSIVTHEQFENMKYEIGG